MCFFVHHQCVSKIIPCRHTRPTYHSRRLLNLEGDVQDIWGPWVTHDGRGCPVRAGTIVEVVYEDRFGYQNRSIGCTDGSSYSSWDWTYYPELKKIVRYREKKPKGLEMLREIVETLDTPVKPEQVDETKKKRPLPTASSCSSSSVLVC